MEPDRAHIVKSRRRLALGVAAILGGLIGLVAAIVIVQAFRTDWALDARKAAIREAGFPTTLDELRAYYAATPVDDDAMAHLHAYLDAWDADVYGPNGKSSPFSRIFDVYDLLTPAQPPTDETQPLFDELHALLGQRREALEHLYAAAEGSAYNFPIWLQEDGMVGLRHAIHIRNTRVVLGAVMLDAVYTDNDVDRAIDANVRMIRIARAYGNEPLIISQLQCNTLYHWAIDLAAWLLRTADLSEEQLARLADAYAEDIPLDHLRRGLAGELVHPMYPLFNAHDSVPLNLVPPIGAIWRKYETLLLYQTMDWVLLTPHSNWREFYECFAAKPRRVEEMSLDAASNVERLHDAAISFLDTATRMRMMRLAIAIERATLAGEETYPDFPDGVAEFLPEGIPIDPYTGKMLRFTPSNHGFMVYSLHLNGIDDGGTEVSDMTLRFEQGDLSLVISTNGVAR